MPLDEDGNYFGPRGVYEHEPNYCFAEGAHRDLWPLARLLIVFATMGLWAHSHFAWTPPPPSTIQAAAVGSFVIFAFCGFLSVTLARLYVALVLFPIYATTPLSAWLYDGYYWTFRTILRPTVY